MKTSMITGLVAGAAIATAGGVYSLMDKGPPTYADVVSVSEIKETIKSPRQTCEEVQVTRQQQSKDENQVLGTVAGAVIGGVLGNQIGGGSGKKIATVAGAAAGGYTGNKVQEGIQSKNTYVTTESQCKTVYDSKEVVSGYNVTYRIGDLEDTIRMDQDPGDKIPLVNGKLRLE